MNQQINYNINICFLFLYEKIKKISIFIRMKKLITVFLFFLSFYIKFLWFTSTCCLAMPCVPEVVLPYC